MEQYGENGVVGVRFRLPSESGVEHAWVVGEFNNWSTDSHPMRKQEDGSLETVVNLQPGTYRFRYYLGDGRWENAWDADARMPRTSSAGRTPSSWCGRSRTATPDDPTTRLCGDNRRVTPVITGRTGGEGGSAAGVVRRSLLEEGLHTLAVVVGLEQFGE